MRYIAFVAFLLLFLSGISYAIFGLPFKAYNETLLALVWLGGLTATGLAALFESM